MKCFKWGDFIHLLIMNRLMKQRGTLWSFWFGLWHMLAAFLLRDRNKFKSNGIRCGKTWATFTNRERKGRNCSLFVLIFRASRYPAGVCKPLQRWRASKRSGGRSRAGGCDGNQLRSPASQHRSHTVKTTATISDADGPSAALWASKLQLLEGHRARRTLVAVKTMMCWMSLQVRHGRTCSIRATIPAARGAAADVPVWPSVQPVPRCMDQSEVTCGRKQEER